MDFDWDEDNLRHIAEHNVTAFEAEHVLENPTLDIEYQDWHGEKRFAEVGITASCRVLVVISTWRGSLIRVVTACDAPDDVIEDYLKTR